MEQFLQSETKVRALPHMRSRLLAALRESITLSIDLRLSSQNSNLLIALYPTATTVAAMVTW
jgi:hypothetical protein